jgi:hypothetical protein
MAGDAIGMECTIASHLNQLGLYAVLGRCIMRMVDLTSGLIHESPADTGTISAKANRQRNS